MSYENGKTLLKEVSYSTSEKSNGRTFGYLKLIFIMFAASVASIAYCFVLDEYYTLPVEQTFAHVIDALGKLSFPEIEIPGSIFRLIKSLMVGLFAIYYSWEIIYFDSISPGIEPPSPLSPSRIRAVSKRSLDLNHILAIINGIFFAVIIFCWT